MTIFGERCANVIPPPKIVERNIRARYSRDVVGECHPDGTIVIDPRQTPPEKLDTLVHELIHHVFPFLSEEAVLRSASVIAEQLWKQGYRRLDLKQYDNPREWRKKG